MLVGTALIVIIPEGIETLYSSSGSSHSHGERSVAAHARRGLAVEIAPWVAVYDVGKRHASPESVDIGVTSSEDLGFATGPDDGHGEAGDPTDHEEGSLPGQDSKDKTMDDHDDAEEETSHDPHAWVGLSLISGFVLMYLIDTLPRQASSSTQNRSFHVSLGSFSLNHRSASMASETAEAPSASAFAGHESRPSSTSIGLIIHAAADGIALGASSTSTSRLSFIIFIALMIHKAPAAFGLTTTLLKQGLSKRAAKAHLIVFSLAAPLGALFTWGAAHILGFTSASLGHSLGAEFATGVLLLFSGGTFLYVAMHAMQENSDSHDHDDSSNGHASVPMDLYPGSQGGEARQKESGGLTDTLVTVAGMLMPLLLGVFGHGH